MNRFKNNKIKFLIMAVMISFLSIFCISKINALETAPYSFIADSEKIIDGYIDNVEFGKLTNKSGGVVYCQNHNLKIPYGITMTLEGEAPAGIAYIISNGYPRTRITGDDDKDYYITQSAIWWYMDLFMGGNNLPDAFKTTAADPYGLRPHIKNLVDQASRQQAYAKPDIKVENNDNMLKLTSDKKYYESEVTKVRTVNTTGNYTVSLENAPAGTVVTNAATGANTNSFATDEGYKIKVPVASVNNENLNITAKVNITGVVNKAYSYKSSDSTKQNTFGSVLYPETSNLEARTGYNLSTSSVSITKIDDKTSNPLAGAKFELQDSKGSVITTWTSTTNAHIIKNLPNGTYTLIEKEAPTGYVLNSETVEFTISDTNRNIVINFRNKEQPRTASIIKIDATTKKPLKGATLVIKDATGKVIDEFVTTEKAHKLTNIKDGEYTVEEKEAPTGYEKTDKVYTFKIDKDNLNAVVTIENISSERTASIIKIDKTTRKPLRGATLVIRDATGKVIDKFVTEEKAHKLTNIKDGEYTVEEIKAPVGYQKSDKVYNFKIDKENLNATVIFENTAIDKLVNILKIDAITKKPLKGATLVVKDATGKVIDEFVTEEKAHTITGLKDGIYTVEEKEAPTGYVKSDEVYKFEISDENPTAYITFENNVVVEVPKTGSNKTPIIPLGGIALIFGGIGFIYYNGKKQNS